MQVSQTNNSFLSAWRERLKALRNIPPGLKIVWEAGPRVVASGIACRIVAALIPLAVLAVSRRIIDSIVEVIKNHSPVSPVFWWLVALEFGLALFGTILARLCDYCDGLLADRFTRHVSIRVMEHASRLDLSSYEDPEFYNKLERARHQATDRIGMVQAFGRLLQETITAITLSVSILAFSPWLLLLLIAGVIPAFLGESHFAFLGYALNMRLTPTRRQLDYLRDLGASKESAKELKLFGLSGYLSDRYAQLADDVYVAKCFALEAPASGQFPVRAAEHCRLLQRLCFCNLPNRFRQTIRGNHGLPCRGLRRGERQYPADLLNFLEHRRSGALPYRSAGLLRASNPK